MSKSHTGNFKSSLKCRLINPAKNEIGDRINKIIGEKVNVNQWRNTDAVITRFENIEKKQTSSYMNLFFFFFEKNKQTLLMYGISFTKCLTPIDEIFSTH